MSDPAYKSAYLKLEWAGQHILNLERVVYEFFSGDIYQIAIEPDIDSGDRLVKVRLKVEFPSDYVSLMIGDALNNMRSAMDHMAGHVARTVNSGAKQIYFPFAGTAADFNAPITQGKINKLPDMARPIIERLQPYRGGDDLLWAISRLRNDDCHNFITPCASAAGIKLLQNATVIDGGFTMRGIQSLDEGVIFASLLGDDSSIHLDPKRDLKVAAQVLFGDVAVVNGREILSTLDEMLQRTHSVLEAFRLEFFP